MSGLYDIITVGSNTIDVFVSTAAKLVRIKGQNYKGSRSKGEFCFAYPLGEKILITDIDFQTGGGGTNTAVSFSRMGFKTAYLGMLGHDENGIRIFNLLHKEKIDFVGSFGKHTGYSVVLDAKGNDRTILTHKGCNDDLDFSKIDLEKVRTKMFYFSAMMNRSFQTLKKLAVYASRKGIMVAFNPSLYLAKKGIKELKPLLMATDVLILNFEEAVALSGKKSMNECLISLRSNVKQIVAITDGRKGVQVYDGNIVYHASPRKMKVVETTGAGDGFASSFTAGIIKGMGIPKSMKLGLIQAESVISTHGAKNNLLTMQKLMHKLKKDKRKVVQKKMVMKK